MNRNWVLLTIIVAVIGTTGCSNNYLKRKETMDETYKTMNELADVLEEIKDRESAEKVAPKIEEIANKLEVLAMRLKSIPPLSETKQKELEKELSVKVVDLQARFQSLELEKMNLRSLKDDTKFGIAMDAVKAARDQMNAMVEKNSKTS